MYSQNQSPTPYPEINFLLQELLEGVKDILGSHFVGMYLEGSLANGDFDQDSDIDFVVVTDEDVSEVYFPALKAMHTKIAEQDSPWVIQLEGSYMPLSALRRHDREDTLFPNIERGEGEQLKLADHDEAWIIHRYILRKRGITISGPVIESLIDPVSPDDLRRAMLPVLCSWAAPMLEDPNELIRRGYPSSYVVLTLCRILYTLQCGDVASKRKAAEWMKKILDERRRALIDRAWAGRHQPPKLLPDSDEMHQTLDFIRYVLERSRQIRIPSEQ